MPLVFVISIENIEVYAYMFNELFNDKFLERKIDAIKLEVEHAKENVIRRWYDFIRDGAIYQKKEEQLQSDFLNDFFGEILNYAYKRDASNITLNLEKEYKCDTDGTKPDGVLGYFNGATKIVKVVIELKDANTNLDRNQNRKNDKRTPVEQAFSYVSKVGGNCEWVIVSNFIELRLYRSNDMSAYQSFKIVELLNPKFFKRFYLMLSKDRLFLQNEVSYTNELLNSKINADEEIFVKFYNEYRQIRLVLFRHIISLNKELDNEQAIAMAQKIIDRIIFVCFCEDLGILPYKIVRTIIDEYNNSTFKLSQTQLWDNLKNLFTAIDKGYPERDINHFNGGLFKYDKELDSLPIRNDVILELLNLERYDFESDLNVKILGHIFEQSINEIEELTDTNFNSQSGKRHSDGIYYTPNHITKYIIEQTIGKWIEDRKTELGFYELPQFTDNEINRIHASKAFKNKKVQKHLAFWNALRDALNNIKIIDPACGSGSFLVQVHDYLKIQRKYINDEIENLSGPQISMFNTDNHILSDNIFGVDINQESVEIAKLSLWLKTANKTDKLTSLDNNIVCGNSLVSDKAYDQKAFSWNEKFNEIMNNGGFDIVITNPPYIDAETMTKFHFEEREYLSKNYTTAKGNYDIYVPFIELCLKISKNNGYAAFITPDKWLNKDFGKVLRKYLLPYLISIKKYGRGVFHDALVDSIVTVTKKCAIENILFLDYSTSYLQNIEKSTIAEPYTLDVYFSDKLSIIVKIDSMPEKLSNIAICESACATSDCYKLKEFIVDTPCSETKEKLKIINTGTISKYVNLWGIKHMVYLKERYLYPCASKKTFFEQFTNTYGEKSKKPKIIIKGLTLLDACIDVQGDTIPGKSTLVICNDNIDTLFAILAFLNSALPFFYIKEKYASNSYNGGIVFQKAMINDLPIPRFSNEQFLSLTNFGKELFKLSSEQKNINNEYITLIETEFEIDRKKIVNWHELSFKEFLNKLNICVKGEDKDELILRFNKYKSKMSSIKEKIQDIEEQCNNYILSMYKMTDDDIHIILR